MKHITINEEYDIDSNKMFDMLTSKKYYDYLLKVTDDLLSNEINLIEKKGNFIFMNINYELKIDLPDFVKPFLSTNKIKFFENFTFDYDTKKININITSPSLESSKISFKSDYHLIDLDNNKHLRKFNFYCNCTIPLIGSTVEKLICKNTEEKCKDKYKKVLKFIENTYNV